MKAPNPAARGSLPKKIVLFIEIILFLAVLQIQSVHGGSVYGWDDIHASYSNANWGRSSSAERGDDFRIREGSWGGHSGTVNSNSPGVAHTGSFSSEKLEISLPVLKHIRGRHVLATNDGTGGDSEVEALTVFRAAITRDPSGALTGWSANDSVPCGWVGIVCSSDNQERVVAINLRGSELDGNINSVLLALGRLQFLQRLDLSNNSFSGSISENALANYSALSYLNASSNQLSGAIPSQIGEQLLNLESLDLEANNLTGEIPASLGNCTSLNLLHLGTNFLEGSIPPALGRLSALQYLNLGNVVDPSYYQGGAPSPGNAFSGSIPTSLGNCSLLTYLDLGFIVSLGGELPFELSQLKNLRELHIRANSFTGALPVWIGNLTNLTTLDVQTNQFFGRIPDTLGQLPTLEILYLGVNNFSGAIPISITNCSSLIELALNGNFLTGNIPVEVGLLRNLEQLWLYGSENRFTGVIPTSISNCSSLTVFNLGDPTLDSDDAIPPSMDPQPFPSWIVTLTNLSSLKWSRLNLHGQIPSEIGLLSNLRSLYIQHDNITGRIPSSLANCTLLTYLELVSTQLRGGIPFALGALENLQTLYLQNNLLTGLLPPSLANLSQMELLRVSSNFFEGTIDGDLGKLSQLQRLNLDDNQFEGPIPEKLSNCSMLLLMTVSGNNISGKIPGVLGNLTLLEILDISRNKIGGRIPVELEALTSLSLLQVDSNNLEGDIPFDIGRLSRLQYLSLSHNRFNGSVPSSLGNCSDLLSLDLSYNQFSGEIPGDTLSELNMLTSMNLSHNLFTGSWPRQLVRLESIQSIDISANSISGPMILVHSGGDLAWTDLARLDISMNNLSGDLPESLGSLPVLAFFNASYNNFQGPVPYSGVFKSNLTEASFLGNPGLCGVALGPHRDCRSSSPCNGFNCKRVWIPVTVAGCLLIILVIGGILWWMIMLKGRNGHAASSNDVVIFNWSTTKFSIADVSMAIGRGGSNAIGGGARSVVYKGILRSGESIAIKTLREWGGGSGKGKGTALDGGWESELLHEVHTLGQLRHRNVLKVLGYCSTLDFKAIVLEYMPQGSLHEHLYLPGKGICELPWEARFKIVIEVGEAMKYFHHDFPTPLIHRDLKPSNVLLDGDLNCKVADFGISKFTSATSEGEASASSICGTVGYMPPEYASETNVSTKGDVFSYGIVLLELLTGRPPVSGENFGPDVDYRGWILKGFQEQPFDLLDPALKVEGLTDTKKREQMMLMMRVALLCTRERPQSRPSMIEVVEMLTQMKEVTLHPKAARAIEDILTETNYPTDDSDEGGDVVSENM